MNSNADFGGATEELIRLQDVPAVVCDLRPGSKRLHWATVYRWCHRGCRGVRLWSVPVGLYRMTRRSAVAEFLDTLDEQRHSMAPAKTEAQHRRSATATAARLAACGW